MATLIRIDRNGTKYWHGMIPCDRCGGIGGWDGWKYTGWTCFKCGGTGKIEGDWKEYTPEYQAKLDARHKAKQEAWEAEQRAKREEIERIEAEKKAKEDAERLAEEARINAQKSISQHIGEIGERIDLEATYDHSAWFETHIGWMTETMYIHTLRTAEGNVLIWKTSSNSLSNLEKGDKVHIRGTVKEHSEYKDEKQTVLTRCKVKK